MSSTIAIPEPVRAEKETRVSIPWGSWYGDRQLELSFPGEFQVEVCEMFDAPALSQEILRACVQILSTQRRSESWPATPVRPPWSWMTFRVPRQYRPSCRW